MHPPSYVLVPCIAQVAPLTEPLNVFIHGRGRPRARPEVDVAVHRLGSLDVRNQVHHVAADRERGQAGVVGGVVLGVPHDGVVAGADRDAAQVEARAVASIEEVDRLVAVGLAEHRQNVPADLVEGAAEARPGLRGLIVVDGHRGGAGGDRGQGAGHPEGARCRGHKRGRIGAVPPVPGAAPPVPGADATGVPPAPVQSHPCPEPRAARRRGAAAAGIRAARPGCGAAAARSTAAGVGAAGGIRSAGGIGAARSRSPSPTLRSRQRRWCWNTQRPGAAGPTPSSLCVLSSCVPEFPTHRTLILKRSNSPKWTTTAAAQRRGADRSREIGYKGAPA